MKYYLSMFLLIGMQCFGQFTNLIAYSIPKNELHLESGFYIYRDQLGDEFIARYGLTDNTEIYLETSLRDNVYESRFHNFSFIAKQKILDKEDKLRLSLLSRLSYDKESYKNATGDLLLALDYQKDKWYFTNNLGTAKGMNNWVMGQSFGHYLMKNLGIFAEYYGMFSLSQRPHHIVGVGANYELSDRFLIDLTLERTFFGEESKNYAGVYFIYKLIRNKKTEQ